MSVLQGTTEAGAFRDAVIQRLALLTHQTVEREKEETRRLYLAMQLANVRLLNEEAYEPYIAALNQTELSNVRDAASQADRLYTSLSESPLASPPQAKTLGDGVATAVVADSAQLHHALEGGIKALGVANYFEVKG